MQEVAAALAEALKSPNASLPELHLHNNQIGDAGMASLAAACAAGLAQLEEVVLSFNRIGPPGCTAMAMAMVRTVINISPLTG